ncbi:MAG: PRC-barrel domain-containing protein, partial [Cyanobacteriota bacterium]|nr:PRC-barrel domain-containing protein [Cyanobacteriota bacterium]
MQKGVDIIGKLLQVERTGEKLNKRVQNLACDPDRRKIVGFWVEDIHQANARKFLPFSNIETLGRDAIAISSKNALVPPELLLKQQKAIAPENPFKGRRLATQDGRDLGTILDLYFHPDTGMVAGYEVSGGIFADFERERTFVPATPIIEIGDRGAIVPSETAALMAKNALPHSREASFETASKSEQKAFVIGKVAREVVRTPKGTQLVFSGQLITSAHAAVAQNLGILTQLYRVAGGSPLVKFPVSVEGGNSER